MLDIQVQNAATIEDLARIARRRVPRMALGYLESGTGAELALKRNRDALDNVTLAPRYARDVSGRSTASSLFGRAYDLPIGVSPVGLANAIWPGADRALAASARSANVPYGLSTVGTTSIEEIARLTQGNLWFQLYAAKNNDVTFDLMRRARDAGVEVLQVTIDVPIQSRRVRDIRNRFQLPFRPGLGTLVDVLRHPSWALATIASGMPRFQSLAQYAPKGEGAPSLAEYVAAHITDALDASHLKRLRDGWPGKFVLKGVMDVTVAQDAVDIGADGIVVSNHGGRQFDAAPAPPEVLPKIVEACRGRLVVMMDSGIRSGEDVLRAISLGADFVFSGRSFLYGVAAGGPQGAEKAFAIFGDEIRRGMAQLGVSTLQELRARGASDLAHDVAVRSRPPSSA
ncbi:alpha-hydroxy acid oxidase [Mesorhizobium sp. A623]